MEGGISSEQDLVSVKSFGVFFWFLLVTVVWIGEGVLEISTCLSGFSLRKAGQGK